MLKSRLGRKNLIKRLTLLTAVACMVLWQPPGGACGQTPLTIDPGEVASVTSGSATIDLTMPATKEAELKVTVFYGTEDGGTKEGAWQGREELSWKGKKEKQQKVTLEDLKPQTEYVYRIRTTGPDGTSWSATGDFRTLAWALPGYLLLLIVIALLVVPFMVGNRLARRFRMPDHGWKIGLVLLSLACGSTIIAFGWPPKWGPDLSGGTILIYEVQRQQSEANRKIDMGQLVAAVNERVNPGGQKEIYVRPYGTDQIEIIIPKVDPEEAKRIEKIVSRAGTLEFRILASRRDNRPQHTRLLKLAASAATQVVKDRDGTELGRWVPIRGGDRHADRQRIRGILSYPDIVTRTRGVGDQKVTEVLVVKDPFDVNGEYLTDAARDYDETGNPRVAFEFDSRGARLFGRLTGQNLPEEAQDFYRKLGIILEGELYSAPRLKSTIYNRGVIEMGTVRGEVERKRQEEEVDDLVRVLNAGSLPAALTKEPVTKLQTGPTLGSDTIKKGATAIGISAALVLLFMLFYYRFAGVVACGALVTNLLLILAIMITVGAAFTLPGLAGLVLTVGMAVDANVLIFERIREELSRGAALRMAIRNGFSRATTTIVDANLTTLITGVILFVIGTDQVKGFAITLILGVVLSMYTAIFCSRVVFDIAERRRWITRLKMMRILGDTQIDFLGRRRVAIGFSLFVIVIGLVGVGYRGAGLLDIDFIGGVSVQVLFKTPKAVGDVRDGLSDLEDLAVSDVQQSDEARGLRFKVDTSRSKVDHKHLSDWAADGVRQELEKVFGAEADTEKRRKAVEALRGQVARVLETQPDSTARQSGLKTLQQQVIDLFADAPESPKAESAVGAVHRRIGRIVRINTPIEFVEERIRQQFAGQLASNSVTYDDPVPVKPAERQAAKAPPEEPAAEGGSDRVRNDLPGDSMLAAADSAAVVLARADSPETKQPGNGGEAEEPPSEVAPPEKAPDAAPQQPPKANGDETPAEPPKSPAKPAKPAEPAEKGPAGAPEMQTQLTFARKLSYDSVNEIFVREFGSEEKVRKLVEFAAADENYQEGDGKAYATWNVKIKLAEPQAKARLASIQAAVADTPFFPSSETIGSTVASSTRVQAVEALAAALLFIVAYIWIRFQRVIFGLAAVVALVHDVLVTLGVIALSAFVAPYLGFLLIDPFKIGLPVVAAFLTIIGYSLNDTIVVFDRIREVRGKSPRLTEQMVNTSINQTLARTLLTSLTTLIVVVILYLLGGQRIHGFAFALVIGVMVGTYSSIFVASPVLLWMTRPSNAK